MNPGRTGGFAGAASQTTIEVKTGFFAGRLAFKNLFDQIDPAARPIQFVAQQLVGRTGGRTKAAVHAFAQDFLGFLAGPGIADEIGEFGFHQNSA